MTQQPKLIDNRTGREFVIHKSPLFIGRHKSCDLCIPVVEVSRRHCQIFERHGRWFIEDLRSLNGTYINEVSISTEVLLSTGDHVKVAVCSKFPAGVKDYLFKWIDATDIVKAEGAADTSELERLEGHASREESQAGELLQLLAEKVHLKNCQFKTHRKQAEVGTTRARRLALKNFGSKEVQFYSMVPVRPGDTSIVSIEHPSFPEPLCFSARATKVRRMPDFDAYRVEATVTDFPEATREYLKTHVEIGPLLNFNFFSYYNSSFAP